MSDRDFNTKSEITGVIDLSRLPPPDFIDDVKIEDLQLELKGKFVEFARARGILDYALEQSDPMAWAIELLAYESIRVRKRTNNQALLVLPPYSKGAWLDNVLSSFGAPPRIVFDDIDPQTGANLVETDEAYLRRALLSPDKYSTTGCDASYEYNCLLVSSVPENMIPFLRHVKPSNAGSGNIKVSILFDRNVMATLSSETPDAEKEKERILKIFRDHLNSREVRNINETVEVVLAEVKEVKLGSAKLHVPPGVSPELVRLDAVKQLLAYAARAYEISGVISVSGVHAALTSSAVVRVELSEFKEDVIAGDSEALALTFTEDAEPENKDIQIVQVAK